MLELINVSKNYKKRKAVDNLSLTVNNGDIFGLVGSNGAGKSTTVSMIATLLRPDSGKILFNGVDITEKPELIRQHMGYVPQDIALYENLTGYDNFAFWGKSYHVKADVLKKNTEWAAGLVGLTPDVLKRKVKEYSGGMKRRLNIGVALLHAPELVILDEPTVGIDVASRSQILSAIKGLSSYGVAVIYVGHYMEEVEKLCNRVCIMSEGRAVWQGNIPDSLVTQDGKVTLEQIYGGIYGGTNWNAIRTS